MQKAAIETFIIDLKVTPEGDVKILELGDLQQSGLTGYRRMTKTDVTTTHTYPFLESFGVPLHQSGNLTHTFDTCRGDKMEIIALKGSSADFDPADISSYGAIVLRQQKPSMRQREFIEEQCDGRVLVPNSNRLAYATYCDKALFAMMAMDTMPDLLPKQHLYPLIKGKTDVAQIAKDFAGHSHVVLKQPVNARGEGVDLRPYRALSGKHTIKTRFATDEDALLIAQEPIKGQLIKAVSEHDREEDFDPTIRVIATTYRDKGQVHVEFHGAYYKLPAAPARFKGSRKAFISNIKDGPASPPLDSALEKSIYAQLEKGLIPYFTKILDTDVPALVNDWLDSNDPVKQNAAATLAVSHIYFDSEENWQHNLSMAQRLYELKEQLTPIQNIMQLGHKEGLGYNNGLYSCLKRIAEDDNSWNGLQRKHFAKAVWRYRRLGLVFAAAAAAAIFAPPESDESKLDQIEDALGTLNSAAAALTAANRDVLDNTTHLFVDADTTGEAYILDALPDILDKLGLQACVSTNDLSSLTTTFMLNSYAANAPQDYFMLLNVGNTDQIIGTSCDTDIEWPDSVKSALMANGLLPAAP